MKTKIMLIVIACMFFVLPGVVFGGGEQTNFGIGFKAGLNRLEGDLNRPPFKPFGYVTINYNLFDFIAVGFESGYSVVGGDRWDAQPQDEFQDFKTTIVPYEGHLKFSFLPLNKINPYVIVGGGGFYWNYTVGDTTPRYATGKLKKGYDSFFKSGGGVEIALDNAHTVYFDLGVTFRYSLTDMLDDINSDLLDHKHPLNDGVFDFYGGFTYYFRGSTRGDRDNDGVPDELDLKTEIKEDPDGYMDHDGKPDDIPPTAMISSSEGSDSTVADTEPPVVLHTPLRRVEANRDIRIKADIYENKLKTASIIYRQVGFGGWKVGALRSKGGPLYEGIIPARYVTSQGVEYCVIAIDEAISGVGYCGLPKLPVRINVVSNPKTWRIVSGAVAVLSWSISGYLMLKKQ